MSADARYTEGGPRISLRWTGGDGRAYYTLLLEAGNWIIDIDFALVEESDPRCRMRQAAVPVDISGWAWSIDPSTPRLLFGPNGECFDTAAMEMLQPIDYAAARGRAERLASCCQGRCGNADDGKLILALLAFVEREDVHAARCPAALESHCLPVPSCTCKPRRAA